MRAVGAERGDKMDGIRLTEERIEQFLAALSARGRAEMTVRQYRSCLCALRAYLGSGGLLNRESLAQWKQALEESGDYSNSTINVRLAAVNSFLEYAEKPEWGVRERLLTPASSRPALTREEYLALLRAAVALG